MDQNLFQLVVGIAGTVGGWILNTLWREFRQLQEADSATKAALAELKVLIVGEYMKRNEFNEFSTAIFKKLDRIELKIDSKVDKD